MTIIHSLESPIYNLFGNAKSDDKKLIDAARRNYSVGPYDPTVKITNGNLIVEIDDNAIIECSG
jgi:hypothetical protein